METRSRRGHHYELRSRTSSKSHTKTGASNVSGPHEKPKLTNRLQGKCKAQRVKPGSSKSSGKDKVPDKRIVTGEVLERHFERMRGFANRALEFHHSLGGEIYEVVLIHGNAQGFPPQGFVRHLEAKIKGDPDAPVLLFFAEFTTTRDEANRVDICRPLGLSAELVPTYADTRGCHFCYPDTVFHPPLGNLMA